MLTDIISMVWPTVFAPTHSSHAAQHDVFQKSISIAFSLLVLSCVDQILNMAYSKDLQRNRPAQPGKADITCAGGVQRRTVLPASPARVVRDSQTCLAC